MNTFTTKSFLILGFIVITEISQAQHWQPVAGNIAGVKFTGIAASTTSPAIVATTLKNGIYRSIDSGASWQHVYAIDDSIFALANIDGKHFCAGGRGFTYTSSDSGITWQSHTFPFPVAVARLEQHPSGALIAGTGSKWDIPLNNIGKGVWLSPDSGRTWSAINAGITKQDPLIEALAITPTGTVLAGIYDSNIGLSGKYGLMKLDSLDGTWERLPVSVNAPSNQSYTDQNLRIGSVFNINILDGQVLASIEGVYINFGYAFTIQKPLQDIDNTSGVWQVKWTIDSIPSQGSYYEHITNVFKDSHDTVWASVSGASNEINNNIYTGALSAATPWSMNMDSITEQTGRFLFSEGVNGRLYSLSYFTGNKIFVRANETIPSSVNDTGDQGNGWQIYPNPATSYIRLYNSANSHAENIRITLNDVMGNKILEENKQQEDKIVIQLYDLLPQGIYILSVETVTEQQLLRVVKTDK